MRILALDMSTKTGWAVLENEALIAHGRMTVEVEDFNVQDFPDRSPVYPGNIESAARRMVGQIKELVARVKPDQIVVENTVKGRNRHTQRILEWLHLRLYEALAEYWAAKTVVYRDPSWWRSQLEIRMTPDDKKNNKAVRQGKKRGKVTPKHLAVRKTNELFGLKLKIKDNDVADAILLGLARVKELNS